MALIKLKQLNDPIDTLVQTTNIAVVVADNDQIGRPYLGVRMLGEQQTTRYVPIDAAGRPAPSTHPTDVLSNFQAAVANLGRSGS